MFFFKFYSPDGRTFGICIISDSKCIWWIQHWIRIWYISVNIYEVRGLYLLYKL